jgi:hypothetical protein
MNTTEFVIREVQGDSGFHVRQLFAGGISEPRESARVRSHREVLALSVPGRNIAHARVTDSHLGYNLCDLMSCAKSTFRPRTSGTAFV